MNNETIADILREMRDLGRLDEKSTDKIPRSFQALGLRTYADRIEAAHRREDAAWRNTVLDFCDVFTMVYEPPFKDCPALLSGAFLELCDKLGIEQVKTGDGNGK